MIRTYKPTPGQLRVLKRLEPWGGTYGANPGSFGGERAAATARRMADRGWVKLDRVSERHIRYSLTPAGRALLEGD